MIALAGPLIQTHDPISTDADHLLAPSGTHFFGTDPTGRDVFSRTIGGARISLFVGVGVLALVVAVGTAIGLIAGYVGGTVDLVLVRIVDMFLTIPTLLLALGYRIGSGTVDTERDSCSVDGADAEPDTSGALRGPLG